MIARVVQHMVSGMREGFCVVNAEHDAEQQIRINQSEDLQKKEAPGDNKAPPEASKAPEAEAAPPPSPNFPETFFHGLTDGPLLIRLETKLALTQDLLERANDPRIHVRFTAVKELIARAQDGRTHPVVQDAAKKILEHLAKKSPYGRDVRLMANRFLKDLKDQDRAL